MTRTTIRRATAILALVAVAALGACSEDNTVGEGVQTEGLEGGGQRLGETTTTAAPVTTAPAAAAPTTAAPTTTAKATATTAAPTTTAKPAATAFEISIYSDTSGQSNQFEPRQAAVRRGTTVRFINKDSVARSVEAADGSFGSGPIAPGASWDYVADTPGQYNYADGTRPYAVGTLIVQ